MCYAIPGNVKSITGDLITVDYFGEERKARNDFYDLQINRQDISHPQVQGRRY